MSATQSPTAVAIRPFQVNVPEAEFEDLRRRIAATRWPEQETVADQSQGVPLAMVQKLARYQLDKGRALRGVGGARALLRGDPSRVQVAANERRYS